jgi:hypothetical protein
LFDTGHNRKTDAHDAHAVAAVAVRTQGLRVLSYDVELETLRMLADRRLELTRARIQTVNRLQRLLCELTPGQVKKDITTGRSNAILSSVRPRDLAGKTRRRLAAEQLAELVVIEKKIKTLTKELKAMVLARGSSLMDLPGVGPVVAARILADVGDVARFADRNRFASWTGTAPLDASSGEQIRHRLSRAGNRKMNHMLHIAAATQARLDTPGADLLPSQARRGQDPDGSHAVPQAPDLRRRLPTAPRRHQDDAGRTREGGSGRALRGVSRIQRGRPAPAHRHFGSGTSRTRTTDATTAHRAQEDPAEEDLRNDQLTTEGSRKDALSCSPSTSRRKCWQVTTIARVPYPGVVVPRLDRDPAGWLAVEVTDQAGRGSVGAATGLLQQGGVPLLLGGVAPDPAWGP